MSPECWIADGGGGRWGVVFRGGQGPLGISHGVVVKL